MDEREYCENCGERETVTGRTACLDVPETGETKAEQLSLCRPCADAFDLGTGKAPVGHALPK